MALGFFMLAVGVFLKDFIYLFMRDRDRDRDREAGSLLPDERLDPRRQSVNGLSHPGTLSCGFSWFFLCWGTFSLNVLLLRVFIMNGCCTLPNASPASLEMIIGFLSCVLLMWCIVLTDLQRSSHPCNPGINPTWPWWTIFLACCWIRFASMLRRNLCIYAQQGCGVVAWSAPF